MSYRGWTNRATYLAAQWIRRSRRREAYWVIVGQECLIEAWFELGLEGIHVWQYVASFAIGTLEPRIRGEFSASVPFRVVAFLATAFGVVLLDEVNWYDLAEYYLFDEAPHDRLLLKRRFSGLALPRLAFIRLTSRGGQI